MKKFVGTIAAGVLLASMAGCSSSPSEDQQPTDTQGADTYQPTTTPADSQDATTTQPATTPSDSGGSYAPAPAQ